MKKTSTINKFLKRRIFKANTICIFILLICTLSQIHAQGWSYVGTPGISAINPTGSQSKIFYDNNGIMHVGYIKGTSQSTFYVLKFENDVWSSVFQHTINRLASEVDFIIDGNGDIFIGYQGAYSFQKMYRVKKFSGGAWSFLGDSIVSYNTTKVDLEIANNKLYFMGNREVYEWDNSNSLWQSIHSSQSGSQFVNGVLNLDGTGSLCYLEENNVLFTTDYYLKLEKFNGTSWSIIGDTIPVPSSLDLHLKFNGSNDPIVGYVTSAGQTPNHNILAYNGSSWQSVSDLSITPNVNVFRMDLTSQGEPIFSASNYGGKVYEFNSGSYQALDSATVSGSILQIYGVSVHPLTGDKYILLNELNSSLTGAVLSVMKYNGGTSGLPTSHNSINYIVYPNPTSNNLTIEGIPEGSVLRIANCTGNLVFDELQTTPTATINTLDFANGIYTVLIESEGRLSQTKIVINH